MRELGTVFLTGGSGFLGRNLLRRLGGSEVRALARSDASVDTVASLGAVPIRGDLLDRDALVRGMDGCQTVFHCAADVGDWDRDGRAWAINVEGTECVLEAARDVGVERVVHVSTEAVLVGGPPIVQADERWPLPARNVGAYPRTKAEAERVVLAANGHGLETVIVRPRFIWGGDDTNLLPRMAQAVSDGRWAWIDRGRYLTSTCHVDNAVHGTILAARSGVPGQVYFLTDGADVEAHAFITELLGTQGVRPPDRSIPRWVARSAAWTLEALWTVFPLSGAPPLTRTAVRIVGEEVTVRIDKARAELGYEPVTTREEGFAALTA